MRPAPLALAADAACVLAFAAAGRASHAETAATTEVLRIAWPFLVGAGAGWVATTAWRAPMQVWPRGIGIWAATWAVGMTARGATGGGLAPTFLLVAAATLGVELVGWRGAGALVTAARARSAPTRSALARSHPAEPR